MDFCKKFCKKLWKKFLAHQTLGQQWSSHWPIDPAYYIEDCRILCPAKSGTQLFKPIMENIDVIFLCCFFMFMGDDFFVGTLQYRET